MLLLSFYLWKSHKRLISPLGSPSLSCKSIAPTIDRLAHEIHFSSCFFFPQAIEGLVCIYLFFRKFPTHHYKQGDAQGLRDAHRALQRVRTGAVAVRQCAADGGRHTLGGAVSECAGMGPHRVHQPAPDALRRLSHNARRTTEAHAAGAARVHGHADRVGQRRVQDMGGDNSVLRPTRRAVT